MAESHRDEIAKLETLYASNPDGRVFTHLAEAYRRAGELDRARELLERGLRRHQDYASAHVVLGRVLADQGLEDEATTSFRRVLELDAENLIARRALAESDRAAGRDADALVHYRELLAHDPSDESLRATIADLEGGSQPAQPSAPQPPAWSSTQADESWEPVSEPPLSLEATSLGGADEAAEPPAQEPLSLDSVSFGEPLDLGTVDFGGEKTPPPEAGLSLADFGLGPAEDEPPAASPPTAAGTPPEPGDEHGWGEWPGAAESIPSGEATAAVPEQADLEARVAEEPQQREPAPALTGDEAAGVPDEAEESSAAESPPSERAGDPEPPTEPESSEGAGEPLPVVGEPASVVTETLASLYLAQGFPDRAAAVYRELLRHRPGDAELEERASAAEAEAEALQATRTGVDEARDVWVSGAPDTWDADARVSTAHGWAEEQEADAEQAGGPSISEYFQRILTWRASGGAVVEPPYAERLEQGTAPEPLPSLRTFEPEPEPEPIAPQAFEPEPEPEPIAPQAFEPEREPGPAPEREHATEPMHAAGEPDDAVGEEADGDFAGAGPFTFGDEPHEERGVTTPELSTDALPDRPADRGAESPIVFGGERESEAGADEPLPHLFEAGVEEEAAAFVFEADFEAGSAEADEGEPLPFALEPMDAGEEEDEPLPFELDFTGSAAGDRDFAAPAAGVDDDFGFDEAVPEGAAFGTIEPADDEATPPYLVEEPSEAQPVDATSDDRSADERARLGGPGEQVSEAMDVPAAEVEPEYPWAISDEAAPQGEPWAAPEAQETGAGEILFLEEAEAVAETTSAEPEMGWDPTIALADVAPPRSRPAVARDVAPSRLASPSAAPGEEEEDEDLEMFRSWLQSLKR